MQLAEMKAVMVEKLMQSEAKGSVGSDILKEVKSCVSQRQKLKGLQKYSANWENGERVPDLELR